MDQERRELSTADLVRNAEVHDRAVKEQDRAVNDQNEVAARRDEAAREDPNARAMLFPNDQADQLRHEWGDIQAAFVDAPRNAVERADALVANTMKRIAEVFSAERNNLEHQWDRGGDVTTEDLRVALQRYRAFFDRLLSL